MHLIRHAALLGALVVVTPAYPTSKPAPATPAQQELANMVQTRGAELSSIDINRIVARAGERHRDIQVMTTHGPVYFGWPSNVTPVEFVIDVREGGAFTVRVSGYTEANNARYAAAINAVLAEAIRQVQANNAWATRPRS